VKQNFLKTVERHNHEKKKNNVKTDLNPKTIFAEDFKTTFSNWTKKTKKLVLAPTKRNMVRNNSTRFKLACHDKR
jgi:hypothetical protein